MLTFEEALKVALSGGHTEEELNYCMELQDYFFFSLKRKDGVKMLGGSAVYIMKEDGKKYFNPLSMNRELGRNAIEDEIIKEGYLEEFRKAN